MIRLVREGSVSWLPGLPAEALPHPLPGGIQLVLRRGVLGLDVQGVVGAFPLANGDTLRIVPKIGTANFLRLLFRAEGSQMELERDFEQVVEYALDDEENAGALVARQLLVHTTEIRRRGPLQGRVKRQVHSPYAVGQVDCVSTALRLATRRPDPVACRVKVRTLNIPENRVLSEAVVRVATALSEVEGAMLSTTSSGWLAKFPRAVDLGSDLDKVERGFSCSRYGGPRDYYRRALTLAQIVLGWSGLGYSDGATVEGDAILLNTAAVFEKYLRNAIGRALAPQGYVVTKGSGSTSLYADGSYGLEPDIVISRGGRNLLVCDAKYKSPDAADHYQVHAYLVAYGLRRGLILAPRREGDSVAIVERITGEGRIVWEAYLPISDLAATEAFLASVIPRFA
jgi:5-methylcytosine-specific restriction endonuclease McrBC regulatory subunit McrC